MQSTRQTKSDALVVIIMPVYNEARHLPDVLASLDRQAFPRERMFLVVVDGNSNDGSSALVREWLATSDIAGCVVDNPRRKIPVALNLALQHADDTDIVMRLDAHTIYSDTYVADAVRSLENAPADVACIGSAQLPVPGTTFEERVVEALYTNPLGLGGADFRLGDDVREVDSVYLGVWRPGILSRCLGFNESMDANEDGELAARLRSMGFRLLRVPLECRFLIKRGVLASIRQWNRYGYFRAKMLQRHPQFIRLRHVAAPAAVLFLGCLLMSPLRLMVLPLFMLYACALFRLRKNREPFAVTLATLAFFPLVQLSFAAGMFGGLLTGRGSDWPPTDIRPARSTQSAP